MHSIPFSHIQKILAEILAIDTDEIEPTSTLRDDLQMSDHHLVEMVAALEDEFGVSISDEQVERLTTARDVHDTVTQLMRS